MEMDRNGLEVLDHQECLRLLSQATVGRIAWTMGALPRVLPVNFSLDGDRILVRTGRGSKLDAAARDAMVAFEVDDFDPLYHSGWSVVVTGAAYEPSDPGDLERARRAPVPRWAPLGDETIIAIPTEQMSGRRISRHAGSD